jgi:predicted chitinase
MRRRFYLAWAATIRARRFVKFRIAGAFEYLRTGRVESFDDFERVNQIMHELGGFANRDEAYEYVAEEMNRLWEAAYPSPFAYWNEPEPHHELSHLQFRFPLPEQGGDR